MASAKGSKKAWDRYYSEWASEYDGDIITYGYRPMGLLRKVSTTVGLGPRILDVGAGTSLWLVSRGELLAGGRSTIVALDISQEMLVRSKRRCSRAVRGDAESLPFADGVFDTVLALELLEALPAPLSFLSEAARVLDHGGHLILTLELPRDDLPGLPGREIPGGGLCRYTVDDVVALLGDAGLCVLDQVTCRGFHVYDVIVFVATVGRK